MGALLADVREARRIPRRKADLFAMFIERCIELAARRRHARHDHDAVVDVPLVLREACESRLLERSRDSQHGRILGPASSTHIGGAVVSTTRLRPREVGDQRGVYRRALRRPLRWRERDGRLDACSFVDVAAATDSIASSGLRSDSRDADRLLARPSAASHAFARRPHSVEHRVHPRRASRPATTTASCDAGGRCRADRIGVSIAVASTPRAGRRWFPYNKGGDVPQVVRATSEYVVDWADDGARSDRPRRLERCVDPQNTRLLLPAVDVVVERSASGDSSFRVLSDRDSSSTRRARRSSRRRASDSDASLGFCNSVVVRDCFGAISPTLNFDVGNVANLPFQSS